MNELYHHGIRGQKWGVRRFQNADGSLTSAGIKRYSKQIQAKNEALDKLKRFKEYGEEDSVKSLNRYNSSSKVSKKDIQKKLEEEFGKADKAYYKKQVSMYDYDDPEEWARDELDYDRQHALKYSKEASEYARRCDALIKHYSDKKVTELTKQEYKSLKNLAKHYYADANLSNPYDDINVEYSKIAGQ